MAGLQSFNFDWRCLRSIVPSRGTSGAIKGTKTMNLPTIDVSALPDLNSLTGVFGSLSGGAQAVYSDDTLIILMVFLWEILPG